MTTQMGIGTLASDDRHLVGQGGLVFGESVYRALSEADVVLAVGCRFSSWLWDGMRPAGADVPGQRLIHLDANPIVIGPAAPGGGRAGRRRAGGAWAVAARA